jgi:hypothetical protein
VNFSHPAPLSPEINFEIFEKFHQMKFGSQNIGGCIKRQPNANQKKTYTNAQGTRAIAEFCKMEP